MDSKGGRLERINRVVVGCQWGDEGKGKVVDLLSREADIVARFQGGNNAGHTLVVDGVQTILHLIPSGILHPGKICVIGNGVVLDPYIFEEELKTVQNLGINTEGRVFISAATNLILPYHRMMDGIEESGRGKNRLDTTKRGIGPAYQDKVRRVGVRLADIFHDDRLIEKLDMVKVLKEHWLKGLPKDRQVDFAKIYDDLVGFRKLLRPMMTDVSKLLQDAHKKGQVVLFEGAQGAMLDVDLGTYPYATSSNTTVGGALTGLGIGPRMVDEVVGIVKAYTTRVGEGPFPTEQDNVIGKKLRDIGAEYGATTKRPRRTGWLDMVQLRHAVRINGVDKIAITKLDVLDTFEEIKVATQYKHASDLMEDFPIDLCSIAECEPQYKTFQGWMTPTSGISSYNDLPQKAREYIDYICTELDVKLLLLSTGPAREQTVLV
ncbi:MAG: adenylosuccinate synthase [Candidatus Thorarchaeota archaeon]